MIELLLYTTLWIWGVNFAFKKDQIFGRASIIMMHNLPKWVIKPLIGCCGCMSSIHGTFAFLIFWHHFAIDPIIYPFFIVCLVGANHIITAFIYDLD